MPPKLPASTALLPTVSPPPPTRSRPELLAPAGNWECARAAVENGADAIYFGLDRFNARMRAENFTAADLPELMAWLHQRGVKGYVTMNTLIFPQELAAAERYLRSVIGAGVDAAIVQDVGICRLIRQLSPDFPIHASTQMTITSAAGVAFARALGCQLVVLARETSLPDIDRIVAQTAALNVSLPLEVFVHGALCVAYSGQCLTSEALGGRSANRGECAQACRMTYELIADGQTVDLGDRQYLLSPQDLSGLPVLSEIIQSGVACLKIEGRLKAPEYVANVTQVYRAAIDRVMATLPAPDTASTQPPDGIDRELYNLEMAFSRGLYTGWFEGIDNQALVHARFGKKRGVYLGRVIKIAGYQVTILAQAPVKPGDGIVFDCGHPEQREQGGRIYTVTQLGQEVTLTFGKGAIEFSQIHTGDRIWKTSDPELDKQIRQSYEQENCFTRSIDLEIHGAAGELLVVIATDRQGHTVQVESVMPLVAAHSKPLTIDRLREQLGRLGHTPFHLETLSNHLTDECLVPVSELNRLRREFVDCLLAARSRPQRWQLQSEPAYPQLLPQPRLSQPDQFTATVSTHPDPQLIVPDPQLIVLVRSLTQLETILGLDILGLDTDPISADSMGIANSTGIKTIYCEFEDPRRYRQAVERVRRSATAVEIWVVPPRITKPSEQWILQQVRQSQADGYLVRNYDHLQFFADQRCIGDFSLNVANGITASYFKQHYPLERLTASYDLNINQLDDLLQSTPPDWFDITIHQHMPMFHMEHCVFCAFLSTGTDFTNCGRPCEAHAVKLRDRVGTEHILQADAGCRNTVFNGKAQTGAEHIQRLINVGARYFRLDFLDESPAAIRRTIQYYQQLLRGEINGTQLWQALQLQSQLGVTRGTIENG
jgi:U32 family peptidase